MKLRLAKADDLPQLKTIYRKIINNMYKNNIKIWDDIYPCEFLGRDIEHGQLYILEKNDEIISAFALCNSSEGENCVKWKGRNDEALYIDRFGVNTAYLRKGIGSAALGEAILLAKEKGAKYLRLFVADINKPAINLYVRYGFRKADGIYDERIDDNFVLHEIGFEINT